MYFNLVIQRLRQTPASVNGAVRQSIVRTPPSVMLRVKDVIKNAVVPAWLKNNSVPAIFGEASAGSIKAYEWCLLASLYLPITLISLWGLNTNHPSEELAHCNLKILAHTMHLVAAVRVALKPHTNKDCAKRYLEHITTYVQDLRELHPDTTYVPNHHMAFHIYDFIRLFGPTYSWWTYPYERLIGQLQNTNTNSRFGNVLTTDMKALNTHFF